MFKQDHGGIQLNLPLDDKLNEGSLPATIQEQVETAYIQSLVAGKVIGIDADGYVQLSNGTTIKPLGILINDAKGGFYENIPALGSRKVSIMLGTAVVRSNQTAAVTFQAGDDIYVDTVGVLTNVALGTEDPIGTALADCAGSGAELYFVLTSK